MSTPPETAAKAREHQRVVLTLVSALRTAAYYDSGNAVMQEVCQGLHALLLQAAGEEEGLGIRVASHTVYVNSERVPASVATYRRFSYLMDLFDSWSITGMVFRAGLTSKELMTALGIFGHTQQCAVGEMAVILLNGGVDRIGVDYTIPSKGARVTEVTPVVAYTAAMQLGADLASAGGALEKGMVRRARHVTQAVVDQILADPSSLLALTTIKDFDRYLMLHSTNVAVLSTLLGERLGLDKTGLGELCLAGFLHDAGKLGVDPDVLHKPGVLDAREWEQMQRHPVLAAFSLLQGEHLNPSNMRAVVVAFEHHMNYDLSGYPSVEMKDSVSLFGNIVAIADCFDALTTARVYRKVNPTPPEAMLYIVTRKGKQFDPMLVKLFVEVLGIYPPGTVLALTGREAGVVCKAPAIGTPLDRPKVRLVIGAEAGTVVDLNERRAGAYVRSAVAVLNPGNRGEIPAVDPATIAEAMII